MGTISKHFLLSLVFAGFLFTGCGEDSPLDNGNGNPQLYQFSFDDGAQGWVGDFTDMQSGRADDFNLVFDPQRQLPSELNEDREVPYIAGTNLSDDLFMFIKRRIEGLEPNTTYGIAFRVQIATNAPADAVGIGGSPGESVYVKAGASLVEPVPVPDSTLADHLRLNIDKGNQSTGGEDAIVIGNVAKPTEDTSSAFAFKTLDNAQEPFSITTDSTGVIWAFFGTDSGFEGRTDLYYSRIELTFVPK